ncbi:MAG: 16S rRNA (cytosine(1402)-N(4))-methyltransferase RsmH [Peptococcaceae bacterium]|nr:MAG: 16S rRNA (cytosine(1402)-N(4))-methyltransferase RsmH [Peptococcaceae bacterium]
MEYAHVPVMLDEAVENLNLKPDGIYVDCTLGGGGHSLAIVQKLGPDGRLVALDRDPAAVAAARERLAAYGRRVTLVRENFSRLADVMRQLGIEAMDGVLFDLGVSSYQLAEPARGFSYQHDAPLDMRMDPGQAVTAWKLINELPVAELARIIREYGEERWADRIAGFIGNERERRLLETTGDLVAVIKKAVPAGARRTGPHPARRTFQALRIAVNRELEILPRALRGAVELLRPQGRICVLTYHSLEDRIVKEEFRRLASPCTCPKDFPVCACGRKRELKIITNRPLMPSTAEVAANTRSRSAKLRAGEKI